MFLTELLLCLVLYSPFSLSAWLRPLLEWLMCFRTKPTPSLEEEPCHQPSPVPTDNTGKHSCSMLYTVFKPS